jgi:hypothetical protein
MPVDPQTTAAIHCAIAEEEAPGDDSTNHRLCAHLLSSFSTQNWTYLRLAFSDYLEIGPDLFVSPEAHILFVA